MGMMTEEDQSFEGLIDHLCDAFQSGETLSELISDFYGQSQKTRETEDTFTDDLQLLARKIITQNFHSGKRPINTRRPNMGTSCRINIMLQWPTVHCSPPQKRNLLQSLGDILITMFGGHARQSRSSASSAPTSSSIDTNVSLIKEDGRKLSKNSRE